MLDLVLFYRMLNLFTVGLFLASFGMAMDNGMYLGGLFSLVLAITLSWFTVYYITEERIYP